MILHLNLVGIDSIGCLLMGLLHATRKFKDYWITWISPSTSPYGAPLLLIRNKYGEIRIIIGYRLLNNNTVLDKFPLPHIDDLLDCLNKAKVFSMVDLTNVYHQVEIAPSNQFKTEFVTQRGLFEQKVLPLGL